MADLSHEVFTSKIYGPQAQACLDDTHGLQANSAKTSALP